MTSAPVKALHNQEPSYGISMATSAAPVDHVQKARRSIGPLTPHEQNQRQSAINVTLKKQKAS